MKRKISIKNTILNFILALVALFFFFLAIKFDAVSRTTSQVFHAIFNSSKNNIVDIAIRHRILILIAMILCITSLSVGGLLLQTVSRNPLASPGVMGLMGSIRLGATILSFVGIGYTLITKQFILMIFAAIPILIIFLMIKIGKTKMSGLSIIFIGISLGIIFSSIEWFVMYNNEEGSLFISTFLDSNFSLVKKTNLIILMIFILAPIFFVFIFSRKFTILSTGDELSSATGNNVNFVRAFAFVSVVIMVPASILLGGNLLFAGIIAPNIARILIRNKKFLPTLLATIFIGIIIIMSTAIMASYIPINIGALLNVIAAPVFILIARRAND